MPRLIENPIVLIALAALAFALSLSAQQSETPETQPDPNAAQALRVTMEVLENEGRPDDPNPGDWLTYGLTPAETRFSPLTQTDRSNVDRLGLAWSSTAGAGGGNQEGTPLVWNRTMYGITTWSVVFAVDAATGEEVWRRRPVRGFSRGRGRSATVVGPNDAEIADRATLFAFGLDGNVPFPDLFGPEPEAPEPGAAETPDLAPEQGP